MNSFKQNRKATIKRRNITEEEYDKKYPDFLWGIPEKYKGVSRDDIPKELQNGIAIDDKHGLYIWGKVGVGKTHALYALKKFYAEQLQMVSVVNLTKVLNEIKKSFNTEYKEDILDYVDKRKCMAYDDIGSEKDTDWAGEQMYRLIDEIYNTKNVFIFTSNLSLKELAERYGGTQGDRIASRLAEMATVIQLKGNDKRLET